MEIALDGGGVFAIVRAEERERRAVTLRALRGVQIGERAPPPAIGSLRLDSQCIPLLAPPVEQIGRERERGDVVLLDRDLPVVERGGSMEVLEAHVDGSREREALPGRPA